jgi:LAS superfamily LD-carboxypeptidase LdcB
MAITTFEPSVAIGAAELTGLSQAHVISAAGVVLQPSAVDAFARLKAAAAREGIDLTAASSFRDFETQRRIWNSKWSGERPLLDPDSRPLDALHLSAVQRVRAILIWSALPGASRHHWGSDLDVYDRAALPAGTRPTLVPAEYAPDGVFAHLADWLRNHMASYGFYRPYSRDRGGVQPEPWHLSHAPTAQYMSRRLRLTMLRQAIESASLLGKREVLDALDSIYAGYVRTVDPPPRELRSHLRRT